MVAAPLVATALAPSAQAAGTPLYPDLKTLAPRELRFDRADITPELSGVFHNVLRFSQDTYNAGDGPLILNATINPTTLRGPSTQRVMNSDGTFTDIPLNNDMYWHEAHHHFHFDNWGDFQLWSKAGYDAWIASGRTTGAPLYNGAKTTSCVTDEEFVTSTPANTVYPGQYGAGGCDRNSQNQLHMGLGVGWGDTYDWYRQLQWIDLGQDTLANGTYVLRAVADPLNIVYESAGKADTARESVSDNESATTFVVSGGAIQDSDPPTGTVAINHINPTTSTPSVSVEVVARDDVSEPNQFRLSNDGSTWKTFSYTSSGSAATTVSWDLTDTTAGGNSSGGIKTVYAQAHDNSGKWGPTFTDTINYTGGSGPPPPPPPPPTGPYAQVVVADHPGGYWRLNESSGTNAADSVGASPGVYKNGVTLARPSLLASDPDFAASFNGTNQSVGINSTGAISPASFVSVEAWIKPTTVPTTGFHSIASKSSSYSLQFNAGRLEFTIIQGGTRRRLQAPAGAVAAGSTYHVVGTYDGSLQRLYVNGALVASAALTGAITVDTSALNIGSWDGSSEFFSGVIDEVAVYPTVLSPAQVTNHYSAGINTAPPPPQAQLSISRSGTGNGSVASSPAGISCGVTCSASFPSPTTVTLTATPAAGSTFTGWSGGGCSGTGTCVVNLSSNTSIDAAFTAIPTSALSVTKSGTGAGTVTSTPAGISCGATCSANFPTGNSITLNAAPAAGSIFTGWSGGGCSGTGSCVVSLTTATTVDAAFAPVPTSALTVAKSGSGAGTVTSTPAGISCGATCSANFPTGNSITLNAAASAGSTFTGWSGGGCSGTGSCVVSLTTDTTVTAAFAPVPTSALNVTKSSNGAGTVSSSPSGISCGSTCSANFPTGNTVTLTATPSAGSTFTGWSGGGCTGLGSCVVSLATDTSVDAAFTLIPTSTLSVTRSGSGAGTVTSTPAGISCGTTCSANFPTGNSITLNAAASAGSTFTGWTGGGCSGTGSCIVSLGTNTTVDAAFGTAPTSSYQSVVTGDAPAGYWRLNETSGTSAVKTAGAANNGTYTNVTLNQPGLLASASNRAALFSGTSSRVQIASNAAVSPTAKVSVEAWIKPTALPAAGAFNSITSKAESYSLQFNGPRLEFTIIQAGTRRRLQAPAGAIAVGGTYHVVGVYDGATQKLYVNGALVATAALTGAFTANTNALYIGSWNGSSEFYRGTIDEVAVYTTALTAAQVSNHYSTGTTSLVALVQNAPDVRLVSIAGQSATSVRDAGTTPMGSAFDNGLHRLYVTGARGRGLAARNGVTIFDTRSWRVVGRLTTGGSGPASIAVDPVTHRVYVTSAVFDPSGVRGAVIVIDGRTGRIVRSIATGPGPKAVAVNARTGRVYVTAATGVEGSTAVMVIDPARGRVIATIPIGPFERFYDNPFGLAVNAATNTVYATNPLDGNVYTIDGRTNAVTRSVGIGGEPTAIALNGKTGRVYVATARDVVVIDGLSDAVAARISVGSRPRGIAVDAARNVVYTTTGRGDLVAITNSGAHTVSHGVKPYGVTVNNATGRVAVADAYRGAVSMVGRGTGAGAAAT